MKEAFSKFPWILVIIIVVIDAASKFLTHTFLPPMGGGSYIYPYGGIPVFENFMGIEFSLSHAINKGMAWGLGSEYQIFLVVLRIVLVAALVIYAFKHSDNRKLTIPLALIIAGALGNILDFFIYGHVVDMFHFILWGYDYPVFNVADASIFIGVLWLLLTSYL